MRSERSWPVLATSSRFPATAEDQPLDQHSGIVLIQAKSISDEIVPANMCVLAIHELAMRVKSEDTKSCLYRASPESRAG